MVVLGYAERRMAQHLSPHGVIAVVALLFPAALWLTPVAPPESVQFYLLVPVAAIAGYLRHATGRMGAAVAVTVSVQAAIAWAAFVA